MTNSPQEIANKAAGQTHILSKDETKKILTPFAFEIDKSLFGLPLAVPWRRGVALFIDFIIISFLAETPGELLAFLVAITFLRLGSKKRAAQMGKKRGLRKLLVWILGAFILLIVLLQNVPKVFDSTFWSSLQEATVTEETKEVVDNNIIVADDKSGVTDVNSGSEQSVLREGVEWIKDWINKLGLSFGWAMFYFSVLTAMLNGQTIGKKLLKIRVLQLDGTPLSVWDSFGRYGGYGAGLATGLMGFFQIYWDPNRQAIHDKISSTIVIDVKRAEGIGHSGSMAGLRK